MDYSFEFLQKRLNNLEKRVDKLNNKLFKFNDINAYMNGYYVSKQELDNYILGTTGGEDMLEGDQFQELDNELKKQKQAIEAKNGKVKMSGSHLIPSDITNGIATIVAGVKNTIQTTATADDVLVGKRFYNSDGNLVEGAHRDLIDDLFLYDINDNQPSNKTYDIHIPNEYSSVNGYMFYHTPHKINLWISKNALEVLPHACDANYNVTIKNWGEFTNLEAGHSHAFFRTNGIDLENLPSTLKSLGEYCFGESTKESSGIVLPANLYSLGAACFKSATPTTFTRLEFPENCKLVNLANNVFENCIFNCSVNIPEGIKSIGSNFMLEGGAKDITFPTTLTSLGDAVFYCTSGCNTEMVTFKGEEPPTVGSQFVNADKQTEIKIYVPDNCVDAYKDVFRGYNVYPISQKP